MRGTRMGADGHGWVCMGANECIWAGKHEKKARRVANGRVLWAYTDTHKTIKKSRQDHVMCTADIGVS